MDEQDSVALKIDGRRVRFFRLAKGLSQGQLGKAAHTTQTVISDLENGETKRPDYSVVLAVAAVLEVQPQELHQGTEISVETQNRLAVAVGLLPRRQQHSREERRPVYAPVLKGRVLASHWNAISEDQIERYEPVEEEWEGKTLLGVTVAGSCLEPEISTGDTVFYEPEQPYPSGAMVVVWHDDDYRVKYAVESSQQRWELCSHNDPPLHANGETHVLGPVRRIVKRPGRWRKGA